jgi:hypothetical protein
MSLTGNMHVTSVLGKAVIGVSFGSALVPALQGLRLVQGSILHSPTISGVP